MSEKVHKRRRREARERAKVLEEQAIANRPSLLERLPSVPSLGAVDKVGTKLFGEDWTRVRNRYFIPATAAATVLILASPALSPHTSYREVGRDIAFAFQKDIEPDYNALWEEAEQNLYGREARTEAEQIENYNAVSSRRFSNQQPHEFREATITNYEPNLRQRIRDSVHYITNR